MTCAAIIVAAGQGNRAGGELPKQWQPLAGRRVIDWTVAAFEAVPEIGEIVVVLRPGDLDMFDSRGRVRAVAGGTTRTQSVRLGLDALNASPSSGPDYVLIHDAARCCIRPDLIRTVLSSLTEGAAIAVAPALPVTDALWRGRNGMVCGTVDRTDLCRAQTPQGFAFRKILTAHSEHGVDAADDVEIARRAGMDVQIVDGDVQNLKITQPGDFDRAEKILRGQMDIRTGTGYDVHRFGPGGHVILCGVAIPHDRGLQGHSDADVGMHALTDAILGAIAEGDIGRHFPPSDPRWKGAESHVFLDHAVTLATEKDFQINNVDVTLVCERPKIGPFADEMRKTLAKILQIDPSRVSVKATTSERLGFAGREEGIAAQAVATMVRT